jgi:FlaA1/EpsC-like NDP-sugar epimerase
MAQKFSKLFDGKRVLVTGGTGSLGKTLVRRLLSGKAGDPAKIIVFSRDETKQHHMRLDYQHKANATDEVIYRDFEQKLEFRIGDVRDYATVASVLRDVDIVINTAAMKQVPACEYSPYEAVKTNIQGAENIVRAVQEQDYPIETVVGVSTDKACKPVNVMGMTKSIQERVFIQGNMRRPGTRFICVRYGNVLASRGSVIPLFIDQVRRGGPVTITTPQMTRFLLSLDDAVDTVCGAVANAEPGEMFIPRAPSALVLNVAKALIGSRRVKIKTTGIRPGEKVHESLISDEEATRTLERGDWYAVRPMLPEVSGGKAVKSALKREYTSKDNVMNLKQTADLLRRNGLMVDDVNMAAGEILR